MAAARSVRRLRSAEPANSRNTALRDVPRRVASASTSLRRSSGIDTMTFAIGRSIPWYTIEAQLGLAWSLAGF
jgi:CRP-like cAMP-binding protein